MNKSGARAVTVIYIARTSKESSELTHGSKNLTPTLFFSFIAGHKLRYFVTKLASTSASLRPLDIDFSPIVLVLARTMSTNPNKRSSSSRGRHAARIIARVLALATAAVAGFSMLTVRELLEDEPDLDGTKLNMPILICMPADLGFGGGEAMGTNMTNMTNEANATALAVTPLNLNYEDQCHSMKYHLHSVTFALGLAALALLIFIVVDLTARIGVGPFNRSTAAGMGLFSTFILFQAAASTGALLNEVKYWEDHYDDLVEEGWNVMGPDGNVVQISEVALYGQGDDDWPMLLIATLALMFMTLLMFLEVMTMMCCFGGPTSQGDDKSTEEDDILKVETPPPALASPVHTMSPSGSASDHEEDADEQAITPKKDERSSFSFPSWSSYVGAGGGLRENLAE
eukprot:scaffold407_cov168-Amphora_coffeaeformis.AAC.16